MLKSDFPRIITLLRKERNISQKQAAADLNVSQALLSHYEKGIRECGLDFLIRTADYYNVSCDYLLGRSPEPAGNISARKETPEDNASAEKKIIQGAAGTVLDMAEKTGNKSLYSAVSAFLEMTIYKMFRTIYSSNPANDKRIFSVSENKAYKLADALTAINEARALTALEEDKPPIESLSFTTSSIAEDFSEGAMLLTAVKEAEEKIKELD